jgi:hypothetical protein
MLLILYSTNWTRYNMMNNKFHTTDGQTDGGFSIYSYILQQ